MPPSVDDEPQPTRRRGRPAATPDSGLYGSQPLDKVTRVTAPTTENLQDIPSSAHPAGEVTKFPLAEPGDYYIGLWSGKPNYGCPYCGFATLDGPKAVEVHIESKVNQGNKRHPEILEWLTAQEKKKGDAK